MPPMLKRALCGFIVNTGLTVILVPMFLVTSEAFRSNDLLLLVIMAIAAGLAYWLPRHLTRPTPGQPVIVDERDRAVLSRVPTYQYAGIFFTLGVWVIVLVAIYSGRGEVPVAFLWLIWWSMFVANGIFSAAGVMIGYWRAGSLTEAEKDPDYLMGGLSGKWRFAIPLALVVVILIVVPVVPRDQSSQAVPRGAFTSDVVVAHVGDPIQFTDTSEWDYPPRRDALHWRWEFGDCTYDDSQNTTHAYSSPGQYTVELTIFYRGLISYATKEDYITVLPSGAS